MPAGLEARLGALAGAARGPRYEILALRYGTCMTSRARCFVGHERRGEVDSALRMDFFLWVLRDGRRTIVIDTGFRPEAAARRGRTCLEAPASMLLRAGVRPDEVGDLVLTHLHYDHTGNIGLFSRATVHVHTRELGFWTGPLAMRGEFAALVEPADLQALQAASEAGRVHPIEDDGQLAPGARALWTGGHTPGQMIVAARGRESLVVIASDAAHFYEELERDVPFAIFSDLPELYAGYDLLAALERRGATIVAGHDPRVLERFPPLDGFPLEQAAVVG